MLSFLPKINVLSLPHRMDRKDHIRTEFKKQGIIDYEFHSGIIHEPSFIGIQRAHKSIVRKAKEEGLSQIVIAEDDIIFSDKNAYRYYIENTPTDYDLYMGCIYYGNIKQNNTVDDFSSLILYTIHERYYDTFLATDETGHLDRKQVERNNDTLIPKGKFVVCPLFCCYQIEGFSDNTERKEPINEKYLHNRNFYSDTQPFFTWQQVYARSVAANNALIATSL